MINLASNKDCDKEIEKELRQAGIKLVRGENAVGEVPSSVTGKLGEFAFQRAWYYWVVSGKVPLAVAEELYTDPVGETDIRVAGHCGCPPPKEWIDWIDANGKIAIPHTEMEKILALTKIWKDKEKYTSRYRASDDPATDGFAPFITLYHIDSEIGLRIFADTLKKYKLV